MVGARARAGAWARAGARARVRVGQRIEGGVRLVLLSHLLQQVGVGGVGHEHLFVDEREQPVWPLLEERGDLARVRKDVRVRVRVRVRGRVGVGVGVGARHSNSMGRESTERHGCMDAWMASPLS